MVSKLGKFTNAARTKNEKAPTPKRSGLSCLKRNAAGTAIYRHSAAWRRHWKVTKISCFRLTPVSNGRLNFNRWF